MARGSEGAVVVESGGNGGDGNFVVFVYSQPPFQHIPLTQKLTRDRTFINPYATNATRVETYRKSNQFRTNF